MNTRRSPQRIRLSARMSSEQTVSEDATPSAARAPRASSAPGRRSTIDVAPGSSRAPTSARKAGVAAAQSANTARHWAESAK
jgi:hypothetical protein